MASYKGPDLAIVYIITYYMYVSKDYIVSHKFCTTYVSIKFFL